MSHIPNSAMPHAMAATEQPTGKEGRSSLSKQASKLADKAGENPKAAAAGAAVLAGAIAAAAIPIVRARKKPAATTAKKGAPKKRKASS